MTLSATRMASMQAARQMFLEEEAPQHLALLQAGIRQPQRDYPALMRAAHSLKGGAATFGIDTLQQLSHRLEDVLERLIQTQIPAAEVLLPPAIKELAWLLDNVGEPDMTVSPDLLTELDQILLAAPTASPEAELQAALENTLEDCLQIAEARIQDPLAPRELAQAELAEQCLLIGEELSLPWLRQAVKPLQDPATPLSVEQVQTVIQQIRAEKDQWIQSLRGIQSPEIAPQESSESTPDLDPSISAPLEEGSALVRLPLDILETLANSGSDTLLFLERLLGQRDQLTTTIKRLKTLVIDFDPVRERLEELYEQMALQYRSPDQEDFDPLQLDRFTDLHESLQLYQELFAQVKESSEDLALLNRQFSRNLVGLRRDLDLVYRTSTQARLIPFKNLADPFEARLERMSQRFDKPVHFQVTGGELLLDRILLGDLRPPLTHLINNAFDHGLESSEERTAVGKPPQGQITLSAQLEGNQVLISVTDDGRGIDLDRIYTKAHERSLTQQPQAALTEQEILEFLFASGFSTAERVSQISGRGVGLDVVKTEVLALGGRISVQTQPGHGTTFTLRLPLGVNLLSVMVVRHRGQWLGILREDILEVVRPVVSPDPATQTYLWQGQAVESLTRWLHLGVDPGGPSAATALLIVAGPQEQPLALPVDEVLDPKQYVVKPLTDLISVPDYWAGATLTPSGDAVPVLLTRRLTQYPVSQARFEPRQGSRPIQPPTVLIAEDSVSARQLAQSLLTEAGYQVIPCRDGQEALDQLEKQATQINLVLTDLDMPRLNGLELLTRIRNHPQWSGIPVVFLTSRTSDQHRRKADALNVNAYLGKPYNDDTLLATVKRLMQRS
ncbi:MAG: response regulator [Synechococcaceae cyanobacterium SM2_3_2]|nr:response regulator [Synechococcaceae cyanobacterium SM2_3_2]